MTKKAPHLPSKDNAETKMPNISLQWMLVLIVIAVLASAAVTLATLVWFAPALVPEQGSIFRRGPVQESEDNVIDPATANLVRQRMLEIRDTRQAVNNVWYRQSTLPKQAIMLTTDGWAVTLASGYVRGVERFWQGFDSQGVAYPIEKVVVDPVSDLLYIKFSGSSFPVSSFANWDDIDFNSQLWFYNGDRWAKVSILESNKNLPQSYRIWSPQDVYKITNENSKQGLLVNDGGELVGFVDDEAGLIFGWLAEHQIASILENNKPTYLAGPWFGYLVEGVQTESDRTRLAKGFYISSSPTRASSSTIAVTDVITHIQNQPVDKELISRQILFAPDPMNLRVIRNKEEVTLTVPKVPVSL